MMMQLLKANNNVWDTLMSAMEPGRSLIVGLFGYVLGLFGYVGLF
jgi:hypothetical protein